MTMRGLVTVKASVILVVISAAVSAATAQHMHTHGPSSQVLDASGTISAAGVGNASPGHAFSLVGAASALFPGRTSKLFLRVTNPNNQPIKVTNVTARVTSVIKASDAPAGQCTKTTAGLVVKPFVGPPFTVGADSTADSPPAYVPILTPRTAPNACQGATFILSLTATAVQT